MDGAEVDHQTSAMVPEEAVTFIPPESRENAPSSPTPTPGAELSFINGLAIVIGLQIGSGIFSAPAQVSAHVLSPGVGVLIWLCSGLLVWTGAATFIELGLAIPQNGGVQEYLQHCYGDFPAFVFTWSWVWVSKPAAMAIISMVFADYSCNLASASPTSVWVTKPVAVLGLAFVTLINCLGTKTGPQVANGFLILKISLVASIALTGIALLVFGNAPAASEPNFGWFQPQPMKGMDGKGSWFWMGEAVTAAFGALFCYGGWETIGFVAGEMKDPARNLPRVIKTSMTIVLIGFALLNVALYAVLPMHVMRERLAVVLEFGSSTFGATGARLYSILIATSAIGTLNVNVFATGRLCVAASKRRYFPSILSNMHYDHRTQESDYYRARLRRMPSLILAAVLMFAETTANLRLVEEVPIYAMIMNCLISFFYIVIGTFNGLVTFVGITEYMFFFLAATGLFIVRSLPDAEGGRTYRTWSGNPIIFCCVSGALVGRGVIQEPFQGLFILIGVLAGWGLYWYRFEA